MKPLYTFTIGCLFTTAIAAATMYIGCAPKNTIGATCPTNAICDKVDFGMGAITVCLSPNDLAQVQAAAVRSRAMMGQEPNVKKADAGLVF